MNVSQLYRFIFSLHIYGILLIHLLFLLQELNFKTMPLKLEIFYPNQLLLGQIPIYKKREQLLNLKSSRLENGSQGKTLILLFVLAFVIALIACLKVNKS